MAALRLYARASVPVVASMSSRVSANSRDKILYCSRSLGCWNIGVKTSDVTVKSEHSPLNNVSDVVQAGYS